MNTFVEGSNQWMESGLRFAPKSNSLTTTPGTPETAFADRMSAASTWAILQGFGANLWKLAGHFGGELIIASQMADSALKMQGSISKPVPRTSTLGMTQEVVGEQPCSDPTGRLIHELRVYLWGLEGRYGGERLITSRMAELALQMCGRLLCNADGDLAIPDAGPGPNGEILFIWRRGDHYLSLEMQEGEPYELFYRNESSGEIWGADLDPDEVRFGASIIEKLKLFPPSC